MARLRKSGINNWETDTKTTIRDQGCQDIFIRIPQIMQKKKIFAQFGEL